MAGYVDAFVCFELPAREASSFCDFWKWTSCNFIAFISSLIEVNCCFLDMFLRINLPNLCPNMIHVDALDFSEWYSEEVISFFWRSLYFATKNNNNHIIQNILRNISNNNCFLDISLIEIISKSHEAILNLTLHQIGVLQRLRWIT